ncbi:MAG: 2-phosphosulfolactate phosphatase, partial [Candidatus Bathyarchaeia archaeon]
MSIKVNIEFLAKDSEKAAKRGDLIIIIDALRCCSSIVTALANGAEAIIPVKTLREAYRIHARNPKYLLAGERGGLKPRGFDLGNSPLEYTSERVHGKIILLTTTSGTTAITRSRNSEWVLIGSFLNAKNVAEKALAISRSENLDISIVQSGTNGKFSLEDFICAGAIIARLPQNAIILSDAALASLLAFERVENDLYAAIARSEHSRKLIELGFVKDVKFSCQMDLFQV